MVWKYANMCCFQLTNRGRIAYATWGVANLRKTRDLLGTWTCGQRFIRLVHLSRRISAKDIVQLQYFPKQPMRSRKTIKNSPSLLQLAPAHLWPMTNVLLYYPSNKISHSYSRSLTLLCRTLTPSQRMYRIHNHLPKHIYLFADFFMMGHFTIICTSSKNASWNNSTQNTKLWCALLSSKEHLGCIWNTSGNHEDEASYEVHTLTVPDLCKHSTMYFKNGVIKHAGTRITETRESNQSNLLIWLLNEATNIRQSPVLALISKQCY